jgi:hypothetical protein
LVELQLFQGGLAPHVMVGGSFTPVPGLQCVEVQVQLGLGPRRSCRSLLSGRRLFAGLSDEYVEPVIEGLQGALATGDGIVTIDRFGFDPVDTSAYVGELTASILGRALSLGRVPEEDQAAAWLKMVR